MKFELHPNLQKKIFILDLPLCSVLLEDNQDYPWIFLVPRQNNIQRIIDLSLLDQTQLMKELDFAQKILWNTFELTQLNVAAIGNKTPQLHVHIIGRRSEDPAWPNTVWDHPAHTPYTALEKARILKLLIEKFQAFSP